MLGRLALGCFDRLNSFRCRCSISLRSIHLAPNYGRTETLTHPDENPILPPANGPRWVMLSSYLSPRSNLADAKTVAESRTSTGHGFHVSADLAAPPASSFICYDWEASDFDVGDPPELIAAHRDSVLFRNMQDFFVYRAGAHATTTSLSLLPTHDFYERLSLRLNLPQETTGVLRRNDDELLVANLCVWNERGAQRAMVDLNVLHLSSSEWEMMRVVPIVLGDGSRDEMVLSRCDLPDMAVPVGGRYMCWVKYSSGFLICDMADSNLILRSLPLPVAPREGGGRGNGWYRYQEDDDDCMQYCRNMCGVGADTLWFMSIDGRCCGGPGRGTCPRCSLTFTVTTWTMSLKRTSEWRCLLLSRRDDLPHDTAELCVLRHGRECWEIMRLTIAHHDGGELTHYLRVDATIAVGTRFMCWVDYTCDIFFHDAADETLSKLLYVALAVPVPEEHRRKTDGHTLLLWRPWQELVSHFAFNVTT
nr:unnamed protein product [Digitaria exilis]